MNRNLHIKVFSFVPKVDLTFIIGHMSDNISYYELLSLSDINIKRIYSDLNMILGGKYSNSVFLYSVSALLVVNYQYAIFG